MSHLQVSLDNECICPKCFDPRCPGVCPECGGHIGLDGQCSCWQEFEPEDKSDE